MKNPQQKYKHAVIATDVVIWTVRNGKLEVLLIKMKKHPYEHAWALPGGLVLPGESLDEAAARILYDKTGVKEVYLEQTYTFGDVDRDPFGRVVSVAYMALIPSEGVELKTTPEYGDVEWFAANKLPALAYDHKEITQHAFARLKAKLEYSTIAYSLLPKEFTLSDLQALYETILGRKLDKRNFRRKVQELEIIKKLAKKQTGGAHRPAELFSFTKRVPEFIEMV